MPNSIYRANVDNYLGLLDDPSLAPQKHATVVKLLIEEEDKLGHRSKQLEFSETRAANGRDRLNGQRQRLDDIDPSAEPGSGRETACKSRGHTKIAR
ncbi:MAG: hypothetical protein KGL35_12995 [Bradyrhizobium sp.]|nr:hypothetical protein [Pseudomonadota bacterium]MDE2469622.1 hypothetical protein [Bradyrhizobium sp.]